ncbi:MAG: MarR family transcriptional regulator [Pseudomonadota bacterium]
MHRAPEEKIGYLLKRLMHVFRHVLEVRLRRNASMSFAHLVTLDQIHEEPGVAGAQLARRLLVTAQTMTELLKRLERDGCIERRPDPNNRRADRWFIRPDGVARLQLGRAAGGPVMTQMLALLSPREVVEFRGFLERCVEGLERENRREALPVSGCEATDSPTPRTAAGSAVRTRATTRVRAPKAVATQRVRRTARRTPGATAPRR